MKTTELLESQIEGLQVSAKWHQESLDRLEQRIKDHQTEIAEVEKDLADLDKPELRHGDYGYCKSTDQNWWVWEGKDGLELFGDKGGCGERAEYDPNMVLLGNHVDDLKLLKEDLEEFEVSGQYDKEEKRTLQCKYTYSVFTKKIWMAILTGSSYFTFDQATEIHQNLGRLLATARKKAKC